MNILEKIESAFINFLTTTFNLEKNSIDKGTFQLNTDEQKQHFGDISSNAAMVLAKKIGRNPRELAQEIVDRFDHTYIQKVAIAGPGFLNFFLESSAFEILAFELTTEKETFFKLEAQIPKKTFSVEFVSANPTGPLHLGHGRGAIIGDVLANVLNFLGHTAIREYYINDAGAQIQKLSRSFKIRCQQAAGHKVELPEDAYHGDYLVTLAQRCIRENGTAVLEKPNSFFERYAKEHMLGMIKKTLADYGVTYDVWFSEKTLHEHGAIEQALVELEKKGYLYEKDDALWFKSTTFGDDKDRVLKKASGQLTYVAADIAYMKNKVKRGADHLLMVLGHDHHSYVTRLQGLAKALGLTQPLEVILYQLVRMKSSGQMVRMSKRAGNIVTLREVIDTVGADVARFFYLNRKAEAQLEFDLELALKKTEENPVYYAQYAYVRINSILKKADECEELKEISTKDVRYLGTPEAYLLKKIVELKEIVETIGINYQTHLLSYYILELARAFHSYYAKNRVIDMQNIGLSRSRLLIITLLKRSFKLSLELLGISQPEKM